jgi:phage terminase large subunit-like protein
MNYLYELFLFPNGKFDDQVDSTSQALNYLDKKKLLGKSLADKILKDGWRL